MTTTFVVCFLVGLGLSVVSFVSGLDRINVFDQIFGHGHQVGGHHAGHHGHIVVKQGHAHHTHAPGKVSAFNMAALTAFMAWFGGTGLVLQQVTKWDAGFITSGAVTAGLVGGSVVNQFLRALMKREKPLEPTSVIGSMARVTSSIREGGTGEIVFSMNGTRHVAAARSDTGQALGKGAEVVVVRSERGIAYVSTWDELGG